MLIFRIALLAKENYQLTQLTLISMNEAISESMNEAISAKVV